MSVEGEVHALEILIKRAEAEAADYKARLEALVGKEAAVVEKVAEEVVEAVRPKRGPAKKVAPAEEAPADAS